MNLQSFSSYELETLLKKKVSQERQLTVEVINLLEEVSSRKLYLQRGFGSLIEYCIKELGYSESSAYRRVSAVRVANELPQVKNAISEGKISLVTVAKAHSVFKREAQEDKPLSTEEKSLILDSLHNKSAREAEKLLLEISPMDVPHEKTRQLTSQHTQVTMVLSEDLVKKLNEIKNLWSHKNPNPSYAELLEMLADFTLQKLKPKTQSATSMKAQDVSAAKNRENKKLNQKRFERTHIPKSIKRKIWQKADNRCVYIDSISGRRCGSQFQLQIEHRHPIAKGGTNDESNLELLCRSHNGFQAIKQFGAEHMEKFLQ